MTGKLFIAQRLTKTYGLDHATSGKLLFEQRELTALPDRQLTAYRRQHVGFVFQFYNLVPSLTAYENVTLVTEISDDPMNPKEALELVGIQARMDHFPSQLSGASNSVLPSLARLPNGRKYFSVTSRPAHSTPKPVLFSEMPTLRILLGGLLVHHQWRRSGCKLEKSHEREARVGIDRKLNDVRLAYLKIAAIRQSQRSYISFASLLNQESTRITRRFALVGFS